MTLNYQKSHMMKKELKYFEYIDQYLNGQLKGEQRLEFEAELLFNYQLAGEYYLQKKVYEFLEDAEIIDLRNQLEKIYGSMNYNSFWTRRIQGSVEVSKVAALLVVSLGLTFIMHYYMSFSQRDLVDNNPVQSPLLKKANKTDAWNFLPTKRILPMLNKNF